MLKRFISPMLFLLAVALIVGAGWVGWRLGRDRAWLESAPPTYASTGPTLTQLQQLGELVAMRVHVADVLEARSEGWLSGLSGAWLIKGDALLAVDMTQARIVERDETLQSATVLLPPPRVVQPRLDHEKTRLYQLERGWLVTDAQADRLFAQAMQQGQRLVASAAHEGEAIDQARQVTTTLIEQFFRMVDWHVTVRWQDRGEDIPPPAEPAAPLEADGS